MSHSRAVHLTMIQFHLISCKISHSVWVPGQVEFVSVFFFFQCSVLHQTSSCNRRGVRLRRERFVQEFDPDTLTSTCARYSCCQAISPLLHMFHCILTQSWFSSYTRLDSCHSAQGVLVIPSQIFLCTNCSLVRRFEAANTDVHMVGC